MSRSSIPPSKAHIWGKPGGCTGWVGMIRSTPSRPPGIMAEEGTAAHWLGGNMVVEVCLSGAKSHSGPGIIGQQAPNGIIITDEIFDACGLHCDIVQGIIRGTQIFGGDHTGIERLFYAPSVHEESFGTVDFCLYAEKMRHLYIVEFKYGHRYVDEFENWQMINYYAAVADEFGIDGSKDQTLTVHLIIVQPRAYGSDGPVREWTVKGSDLRPYVNQLNTAAHEALGDSSRIRTSVHCRDCNALYRCPAALQAGMSLLEIACNPYPDDLPIEALGIQYSIIKRALDQLKYLETGLKEELISQLRLGKNIPGYLIETTTGHLTWNRPVKEIIALGDMSGYDLRKEKTITPTQAINGGMDETLVRAYSEKPNTGLKLTEDNLKLAKKIFSKSIIEEEKKL